MGANVSSSKVRTGLHDVISRLAHEDWTVDDDTAVDDRTDQATIQLYDPNGLGFHVKFVLAGVAAPERGDAVNVDRYTPYEEAEEAVVTLSYIFSWGDHKGIGTALVIALQQYFTAFDLPYRYNATGFLADFVHLPLFRITDSQFGWQSRRRGKQRVTTTYTHPPVAYFPAKLQDEPAVHRTDRWWQAPLTRAIARGGNEMRFVTLNRWLWQRSEDVDGTRDYPSFGRSAASVALRTCRLSTLVAAKDTRRRIARACRQLGNVDTFAFVTDMERLNDRLHESVHISDVRCAVLSGTAVDAVLLEFVLDHARVMGRPVLVADATVAAWAAEGAFHYVEWNADDSAPAERTLGWYERGAERPMPMFYRHRDVPADLWLWVPQPKPYTCTRDGLRWVRLPGVEPVPDVALPGLVRGLVGTLQAWLETAQVGDVLAQFADFVLRLVPLAEAIGAGDDDDDARTAAILAHCRALGNTAGHAYVLSGVDRESDDGQLKTVFAMDRLYVDLLLHAAQRTARPLVIEPEVVRAWKAEGKVVNGSGQVGALVAAATLPASFNMAGGRQPMPFFETISSRAALRWIWLPRRAADAAKQRPDDDDAAPASKRPRFDTCLWCQQPVLLQSATSVAWCRRAQCELAAVCTLAFNEQ